MESDVFVLLLGACEGAYALASSFAGEYGIPVVLMDEEIPKAYRCSRFFSECRAVPGIAYDALLFRALSDFYEAHAGKSLLLLPMTERYAARLLILRPHLERMYLLPQKEPVILQKVADSVDALLLVYTAADGSKTTFYATVAARTEANEVLAVITSETPKELLACLPKTEGGIALYAVNGAGKLSLMGDDGAISPFCAFPSAADTALAECILSDYVFCQKQDPLDDFPRALFSPYAKSVLKKNLLPEMRRAVNRLLWRRLSVTLAPPRGETKRPFHRLALRRFYKQNLQKLTNEKK